MRHKWSIIISPEDAVRTLPRRALCLSPSLRLGAFIPLMRRILLSLHCPSPPSVLHHSLSCDLHPSHPLASPGPVTLPVDHSDCILYVKWMNEMLNHKWTIRSDISPLNFGIFFSNSNSPSLLQPASALPTNTPQECPNTWNVRRRYLTHSLSTQLLSAALSVVPSSSRAFAYWLSLRLPTSSRFFCRTAYQQQSCQCLCRNVINLTFGMDSRLSAVQLVWSPIWKTHCWCWGKCIFIETLFQHSNVLLWFSCSLDEHLRPVLNCIGVGCSVRLIMKSRSSAPQVFSSSPTCCLCSLEGSQSFSWRLHLDNSWSKEGSLPGTLHPSLKVSGLFLIYILL